jgi:hypothetical protein
LGFWEAAAGEGGSKPKFPYCKQTVFAVEQYVLGYNASASRHTMAQKIKSQSILQTVILPLLECQAKYAHSVGGEFWFLQRVLHPQMGSTLPHPRHVAGLRLYFFTYL